MGAIEASDEQLWQVCRRLPTDNEPYGEQKQEGDECVLCRWFQPLLRNGPIDWGICANTQSPRAGLLTFRQQACGQFEQEFGEAPEDVGRARSDFKNRVANLLEEALFDYALLKTAVANDPMALGVANTGYDPLPPKYKYWVRYWDNKVERLLGLLGCFVSWEACFDAREAAKR